MSNSVYSNPPDNVQYRAQEVVRSAPVGWSDLPLAPHDIDVLRDRGLTPELVTARHYRTVTAHEARDLGFGRNARAGLLIPIYNLAAEHDGYMLRPHEPVIDPDTGKARKYLFAAGQTPALSGPPAGTPQAERWTHKLREDLNTPIIVTESMLKGDSALSHAQTSVYTLAIHGTWNWTSNGAPAPALRNIPWRSKQGERVVQRRLVVLVPDSDYATKPEVAFAWWTFGDMLRDKKADVRIYHLPTAADGSKLGPDDALAQGVVTVAQMLADATPLPDELPAIARQDTSDTSARRIATLEADLARANALISAQALLLKCPELKDKQRALGYSAITLAAHKASRGEINSDGRVALSAAEVSNDWRPKPAKGEATPETNADGSRPLARRETVKGTLSQLAEAGALDVVMMPTVRTHANGDRYADTEILIRPVDLPAAILDLASYRRGDTRKPYTKQDPCPHCGEVHSRTRVDYCDGCGSETARKHLPVPDADQPIDHLTPDKLFGLNSAVSGSGKFAEAKDDGGPAPVTNCQENLRSHVSDASRNNAEPDAPLVPRCTWHLGEGETCGEPTEAWEHEGYGNTRLCTRHAEKMRNSGAPPPRAYREGVVA